MVSRSLARGGRAARVRPARLSRVCGLSRPCGRPLSLSRGALIFASPSVVLGKARWEGGLPASHDGSGRRTFLSASASAADGRGGPATLLILFMRVCVG